MAKSSLTRCVDSILGQSYHNIQLILIDDGSPDCCGLLCDGYAAVDHRVTVLHQKNSGVAAARNYGLSRADGQLIAFADADDYLEPDFIFCLKNCLEQTGADMAQCGEFWEGRGSVPLPEQQEEVFVTGPIEDFGPRDWTRLRNACWGKLYCRELIVDSRFDPQFSIGEDQLFNLQVLSKAKKLAFVRERKYHYVQSETGATRTKPDQAALTSCRRMLIQAAQQFSEKKTISRYLWAEQRKNDLDICSRIVRFQICAPDLRREIQRELRKSLPQIREDQYFTKHQYRKAMLIVYAWPVYRLMIRHADRKNDKNRI